MNRYTPLLALGLLLAPACDDVQYQDDGSPTQRAYDDAISASNRVAESLCGCEPEPGDCGDVNLALNLPCEAAVYEAWEDGLDYLRCIGESLSGIDACLSSCMPDDVVEDCVAPSVERLQGCGGEFPADVRRELDRCTEDECGGDGDCPGANTCHGGFCVKAVCDDADDCGASNACYDGICQEECFSDPECGEGYRCEELSCEPDPGGGGVYRFVLIESAATVTAGLYPGPDIDAVGLVKANGREVFATAVELVDIPVESEASDPHKLLGPPDTGCEDLTAMTALGVVGNYVVVSFGTVGEDITVENGDTLRVYELGESYCGMFDDDYVHLSAMRSPGEPELAVPLCSNCQETLVTGL
jgi:hypothetical protein